MTEHISLRDFCRMANLSRQRIYQLWAEGKGPPYTQEGTGRRQIRIAKTAATSWCNEHIVERATGVSTIPPRTPERQALIDTIVATRALSALAMRDAFREFPDDRLAALAETCREIAAEHPAMPEWLRETLREEGRSEDEIDAIERGGVVWKRRKDP